MSKCKRYLLLTVLCLHILPLSVAMATAWLPEKPVTFEGWLEEGDDYVTKNELSYAILDYTNAIELDPDNAQVYYKRGMAYSRLGYCSLGIKDFSMAIKLNPKYAEAYFQRGEIYHFPSSQKNLRNSDLAIKDYSKAIELKPSLAQAYFFRGSEYIEKDKFDLAIADYNKVIELNPDGYLSGAYYGRGQSFGFIGNYQNAVDDLKESLRLDTMNRDDKHFALAQALELSGKKADAVKFYELVKNAHFAQALSVDKAKAKIDARMNGDWESYKEWL